MLEEKIERVVQGQEMAAEKIERVVEGQEMAEEKIERVVQGQEMAEEKIERVVQVLQPLCQHSFELVPASSSSCDPDWHERVCHHYHLRGCTILSQIFPETHKWFCQRFRDSYFGF